MKDLKNLTKIVINGARVSDTILHTMSNYCRSLVEIGLFKCIGVTNLGVAKLVYGCVDLKIVDLTCCHSITDAALSAIAYSCKLLVCLKLESCSMITEKGLEQLGSCCILLEELDLTDCYGVNDKGEYMEILIKFYYSLFRFTQSDYFVFHCRRMYYSLVQFDLNLILCRA